MIGLIGIDVDGTLLDSEGRMPDANRDAICDAVSRGIHVALVTGRSFPFAGRSRIRCPRACRSS
jgi:hydroxymethylpyrimidine pyrophosphatase-like HAD family hydrolase